MEEKSKKMIKGTMVSIIANVIVYIVSTVALYGLTCLLNLLDPGV